MTPDRTGGDPDPTGCGTIFLWRNGNCHIWGMQQGDEILAVDSSPFPGATAAHAKNPPPLNRQQQAFAPSTNPTWQTLRRYQHTRRTGARHQSVALVFPPSPSSSRLLPCTRTLVKNLLIQIPRLRSSHSAAPSAEQESGVTLRQPPLTFFSLPSPEQIWFPCVGMPAAPPVSWLHKLHQTFVLPCNPGAYWLNQGICSLQPMIYEYLIHARIKDETVRMNLPRGFCLHEHAVCFGVLSVPHAAAAVAEQNHRLAPDGTPHLQPAQQFNASLLTSGMLLHMSNRNSPHIYGA
ncbi:hypothetical protein PCL_11425 [Purpureocillium lilacinum]|uniref:Uncharacterized protein n=1 Tax=Purpureocillium lilacinum TaxID=33203 RepID=A0A2U3EA05_PURLI|nr:hypothetical protein PCL_11425 [Purpureocillium lilacinum]